MSKNPARMASTAWSVPSNSPRSKWNVDYLARQRVIPKTNLFFVFPIQSAEVEKLLSFQKGEDVCVCLGGRSKKLLLALSSELVTGTAFACKLSHLFLGHYCHNNSFCRIFSMRIRQKTSCYGLSYGLPVS